MLLRSDDRGVIAIGHASHAWISGQLARAWVNPRFGPLQPYEEVCLGAEQHDLGMAAWDLAPSLNPDTGLPHSFIELPLAEHMKLWRAAPRRLITQSRYAALLVSMHGTRLYERRNLEELSTDEVMAVRGFLAEQQTLQRGLIAALRADPATEASVAPERLARNSQLVWTWDYLSLALCLDWAPGTATAVPSAQGPVDLRLEPGEQPGRLTLDPWPFASEALTVRAEGRRLVGRFDSDERLATALASAPWETVELELIPSPPGAPGTG